MLARLRDTLGEVNNPKLRLTHTYTNNNPGLDREIDLEEVQNPNNKYSLTLTQQ